MCRLFVLFLIRYILLWFFGYGGKKGWGLKWLYSKWWDGLVFEFGLFGFNI